ncbi:hypothetical protein ACFWEN_38715, partial [Streptomyces anthocyanicus]
MRGRRRAGRGARLRGAARVGGVGPKAERGIRRATGVSGGDGPYPGPMSALEPRDAGTAVAPSSPEAPRGSVLDAAHRALSVGIVSVVLLIAFEATAVGTAMPVA